MKTVSSSVRATGLVVGGGLVGLSSALHLQRSGISVTVLEPQEKPQGASWGNAGHLAVEQVQPLASSGMIKGAFARLYPRGALGLPVRQIGTWGPFALKLLRASSPARFAAGTKALSGMLAQAMPAWQRLCAITGTEHLLRQDGHFVAWESERTAAGGRAHWFATDIGTASVHDATPDELAMIRALAPKARIAGAVRFAGSGQITDLGALANGLRQALLASGGTIRRAQVDGLHIDSGAAFAQIGNERLTADHVVLSAGAASADLLRPIGVRMPLIAERGYHIQSAQSRWPADMPPVAFEDRSMIVTRFAGGLRAASFIEFAARAAPPDPGKWQRLRSHVAALGLPFDAPGTEWIGARPTLPDYLPAIGRSTRAANLLYAFGHQHLGLTLAAVTGEVIAALATDTSPITDIAAFDPARFGDTT
ncbi:FAD-binding oxidoreductase [Blastomonas sp.]|uniref:NAD(P)/FAD-dependent oxidoreductase n=1 Tax=Blastomonas sp. TaxID=1909299 RepID=UPI002615E6A8|nr:FAD-binding oxidoreductase [Blastomonas sp.]MDM7957092.1 FAD-binding oxidoreductase [Blastomonas sp.]